MGLYFWGYTVLVLNVELGVLRIQSGNFIFEVTKLPCYKCGICRGWFVVGSVYCIGVEY